MRITRVLLLSLMVLLSVTVTATDSVIILGTLTKSNTGITPKNGWFTVPSFTTVTLPAGAVGAIAWDTTDSKLKAWDGDSWEPLSYSTSGSLDADTIDGMQPQGFSAGFTTMPTFTDNGNGTATIGSGVVHLYANSDGSGQIAEFTVSGFTASFTDNTNHYVVVSYNSGSPVMSVTTDVSLINEASVCPVYTVYRDGTTLYKIPWTSIGQNLSTKLHYRLVKTDRFARESGLLLSEDTGRVIEVSTGKVFYGSDLSTLADFNSTSNTAYLYYKSSSVWTKSEITQYDNSHYYDTDLRTLSTGRFAINWVYRVINQDYNSIAVVLGDADYTLAQALAAQPPIDLPAFITSHTILVGRIIVRKGDTEATEIDSVFSLDPPPTTKLVGDGFDVALGNGVVSGMALSINADTTKFDIASGYYFIPDSGLVEFDGITGVSVTNIATHLVSYIAIDEDENVIQSTTPFTAENRRSYVILGAVIHSNKTIINVINNLPDVANATLSQLNDLIDSLKNFNIDGNEISAYSGDGLHITKSAGYIFKKGVNFSTSVNNPHIKTMAVLEPVPAGNIRYRTQDGDEYTIGDGSVLSASFWDDGGVRTPLMSGYTIQRVALFPSNLIRIQYGQTVYPNMEKALEALNTEDFNLEQNIAENGLLRCTIVLKAGATDLTDTTQARFFNLNRWGEVSQSIGGVGGTQTLQSAYDNSPTSTPEIITDSTRGALTLQMGSGADEDTVLGVANGDSATTFSVAGNGSTTTSEYLLIKNRDSSIVEIPVEINTTTWSGAGWTVSDITHTATHTEPANETPLSSIEFALHPYNEDYILYITVTGMTAGALYFGPTGSELEITANGVYTLPVSSTPLFSLIATPLNGFNGTFSSMVAYLYKSSGHLRIESKNNSYFSTISNTAELTGNLDFYLPYQSGTLALTSHTHFSLNGYSDASSTFNNYDRYTQKYYNSRTGEDARFNLLQINLPMGSTLYPLFFYNNVDEAIDEFPIRFLQANGTSGGSFKTYQIDIPEPTATGTTTVTLPSVTGTLWGSGNDGTGSGLDSDMLDGNHASAFLTTHKVIYQEATMSFSGELTTYTGKLRWRPPTAITITGFKASINTAPTGTDLIVRLNETGVSLGTTTISASAYESTKTTLSESMTETDYLTIDITQVGSTVAGSDMTVTVYYTY